MLQVIISPAKQMRAGLMLLKSWAFRLLRTRRLASTAHC